MTMKILVCISNVPDTTTKVTFSADNTQFNTSGIQFILNPYDEIALSKALELSEDGNGTVTVIHVGDQSSEPTIRKALAIGATEAVRVDSPPFDGFFVAQQIAAYAEDKGFDLILTGLESIDFNNGQVAGMLAELLQLPVVAAVKQLSIENNTAKLSREIEGGKENVSVSLPLICSCAEGLAEPKIANMRGIMAARSKPLEVLPPADTEHLTKIIKYDIPAARGSVKIFSSAETGKLVELLHTEAKVI